MSSQELRLLNIVYNERPTRIDVTGVVDLSQVRRAIKADWPNALVRVDAAEIELYDKEGKCVDDSDQVPEEYFKKLSDEGSSLAIRIPWVGKLNFL